jgi:hypothetical protein
VCVCMCVRARDVMVQLKLLVLDEADQMLDHGFKEVIYDIFSSGLPRDMQVLMQFTMVWLFLCDCESQRSWQGAQRVCVRACCFRWRCFLPPCRWKH